MAIYISPHYYLVSDPTVYQICITTYGLQYPDAYLSKTITSSHDFKYFHISSRQKKLCLLKIYTLSVTETIEKGPLL